MKLTESQLRKLVKEELDQMVDEGLLDFFKGAGAKQLLLQLLKPKKWALKLKRMAKASYALVN